MSATFAEVPDVALLGLGHFRIALALGILRRTRRGNQRRIDQRALAKQKSLLVQQRIDLGENQFSKPLGFQQMAEVEDGRFIRDGILAGINAGKHPHHQRVVQCFLHAGI
jgi:hypothetical protein